MLTDERHDRMNVPGATMSGLIRTSPVSFSGPCAENEAISSALSAWVLKLLIDSGTFVFGVAALKSPSCRFGSIVIVAGSGRTLSEAPTVRQFFAVPGADTVDAPGPAFPAAITTSMSRWFHTKSSTSSENAVYFPRLTFDPQLFEWMR